MASYSNVGGPVDVTAPGGDAPQTPPTVFGRGRILAGWSSNSKYSLLGGLRSSAQMISYELSYGVALATVIMLANSMSLREIVDQQSGYWFGVIPRWNVFAMFPLGLIAFTVYAIAGIAETNRAPFDFP